MSPSRKLVLFVFMLVALMAATVVSAASQSFSGYIASGAQQDSYSLYFQAGQSIIADLTCDDPATLDPVLSLTNNAGEMLAYNDDGGIKHCNNFWSSRITYTFSESGNYTFRVDGFGSSTGAYTLRVADGVAGFVPSDDRINPHAFAPVAVYCRDGAVDVWSIDSAGQGTPLFTGDASGGSAGGVTLSLLADGRWQVNAPMLDGKTYLFIFNGCLPTASETYTVENGNVVLFEQRSY